MKKRLGIIILLGLTIIGRAQETAFHPTITRATLEGRASYHLYFLNGAQNQEDSGFKGNYLQFLFSLDITPKLHFDYRQRFNKPISISSFFDATDKLLLIYNPTEQWDLRVGKRPVAIGGCDYAIIPIDLYFTGQYCDLLTIYQWGVSGRYTTKKGNDSFMIEFTQSPFRTYSTNKNIYAYSFLYEATHGPVDFIYSVNFFGTETGKYVNWIVLGHRFNIGKKVHIEADVIHKYSIAGKKATNKNRFLFKDYSLVGKVIYNPIDQLSLAVKYCYDENSCEYESIEQQTAENCDYHVLPGTRVHRIGGIVEYYPLKGEYRNFIRLHLAGHYDMGVNTDPNGTVLDKQAFLTVGFTAKLDLLKVKVQKKE